MSAIGSFVAISVSLTVGGLLVWAWWKRPAGHFREDTYAIWAGSPWGKQIVVDAFGLEIILLLWMAAHAADTGSWLAFAVCAVTMPLFGAMSAGAYWLIAFA